MKTITNADTRNTCREGDGKFQAGDKCLTDPSILCETQGPVALISLNRPAALNSFTPAMHQELRAALDQIEADPAVRALVITGAGRGFLRRHRFVQLQGRLKGNHSG